MENLQFAVESFDVEELETRKEFTFYCEPCPRPTPPCPSPIPPTN